MFYNLLLSVLFLLITHTEQSQGKLKKMKNNHRREKRNEHEENGFADFMPDYFN